MLQERKRDRGTAWKRKKEWQKLTLSRTQRLQRPGFGASVAPNWEPITDVVVSALKNAGPNSYPWITLGRSLLQLLTMETRQGEVGQCLMFPSRGPGYARIEHPFQSVEMVLDNALVVVRDGGGRKAEDCYSSHSFALARGD